jgi:hypothetical protein
MRLASLIPCLVIATTTLVNAATITVPFDLVADEVFVRGRVNGSEWLWFSVDSGASSMILDAARARELRFASGEQRQGRGAGAGGVTYTKLEPQLDLTFADLKSSGYSFIAHRPLRPGSQRRPRDGRHPRLRVLLALRGHD